MRIYEIFVIRNRIHNIKKVMFRYKELSHNYMYKKTRMELLDLVFENKEIFSDKEYLSLMNTQ